MANLNYIKPVVQLIEVEMENSFLATSEVGVGADVNSANRVSGAYSSGKWGSSSILGNNAVIGVRSAGK